MNNVKPTFDTQQKADFTRVNDRYLLNDYLFSGEIGTLYRGHDTQPQSDGDHQVLIHFFPPRAMPYTQNREQCDALKDACKIANAPVLPIRECGWSGTRAFFVLETPQSWSLSVLPVMKPHATNLHTRAMQLTSNLVNQGLVKRGLPSQCFLVTPDGELYIPGTLLSPVLQDLQKDNPGLLLPNGAASLIKTMPLRKLQGLGLWLGLGGLALASGMGLLYVVLGSNADVNRSHGKPQLTQPKPPLDKAEEAAPSVASTSSEAEPQPLQPTTISATLKDRQTAPATTDEPTIIALAKPDKEAAERTLETEIQQTAYEAPNQLTQPMDRDSSPLAETTAPSLSVPAENATQATSQTESSEANPADIEPEPQAELGTANATQQIAMTSVPEPEPTPVGSDDAVTLDDSEQPINVSRYSKPEPQTQQNEAGQTRATQTAQPSEPSEAAQATPTPTAPPPEEPELVAERPLPPLTGITRTPAPAQAQQRQNQRPAPRQPGQFTANGLNSQQLVQRAYNAIQKGLLDETPNRGAIFYIRLLKRIDSRNPQILRLSREVVYRYHQKTRLTMKAGRLAQAEKDLWMSRRIIREFNLNRLNSAQSLLQQKLNQERQRAAQ